MLFTAIHVITMKYGVVIEYMTLDQTIASFLGSVLLGAAEAELLYARVSRWLYSIGGHWIEDVSSR